MNGKEYQELAMRTNDDNATKRLLNLTLSDTTDDGLGEVLSVKLDAPVLCRLDAPELDFACCASADCLHQHLQVI